MELEQDYFRHVTLLVRREVEKLVAMANEIDRYRARINATPPLIKAQEDLAQTQAREEIDRFLAKINAPPPSEPSRDTQMQAQPVGGSTAREHDWITCPRCGMTSYNANDVRQRYCGHCHMFHDDPVA